MHRINDQHVYHPSSNCVFFGMRRVFEAVDQIVTHLGAEILDEYRELKVLVDTRSHMCCYMMQLFHFHLIDASAIGIIYFLVCSKLELLMISAALM